MYIREQHESFHHITLGLFGCAIAVNAFGDAVPTADMIALFEQHDRNAVELKRMDLQIPELKKLFWAYYDLASAPLYQIDYNEKTGCGFEKGTNYETKNDILDSMESFF